jgi:hypothetical protein
MVTKQEPTPHDGIAARTVADRLKGAAPEPVGTPDSPATDTAKGGPGTPQVKAGPPRKTFDPSRFGAITIPPEIMLSAHQDGPREEVPAEQFRALIAGEDLADSEQVAPGQGPAASWWGSGTTEQFERAAAQDGKQRAELTTQKLPRVIAAELERRQRRIAVGVGLVTVVLLGFTWWAFSRARERLPGISLPEGNATPIPSSPPMLTRPAAEPKSVVTEGAHAAAPPATQPSMSAGATIRASPSATPLPLHEPMRAPRKEKHLRTPPGTQPEHPAHVSSVSTSEPDELDLSPPLKN